MKDDLRPAPSLAVVPSPDSALARSVIVSAPGGFSMTLPPVIASAGEDAAEATFEFFTARLGNSHTRLAYGRAVERFCAWLEAKGVPLAFLAGAKGAPTVAAYLHELGETVSIPSVKLHLSALRHWLDWLVTRGALRVNPALSVRTERYSVSEGKTPVLEPSDANKLLDSMKRIVADAEAEPGNREPSKKAKAKAAGQTRAAFLARRDRAAVAVMLYNWLRAGALCAMSVGDFVDAPSGAFLLAHEKGGKQRRLPAHHVVAEALRAYLAATGLLEGDRRAPLFQSAPARSVKLSGVAMRPGDVLRMVKRRARAVGLGEDIGAHSLRATGITTHQENGGRIEDAARLAGHADVRTTALYDRSKKKLERSEVERVQF
jgi:integrase